MKQEFIDLAKYRLEKSKNTLSDARKIFKNATAESVVNRIYYAIFYSVNALLITEGKYSSKHSGVRSIFNRDFVKCGIIDKKYGKFFSTMFDNRQEGDYKDFVTFKDDDIEVWLQEAEDFIEKIEILILDRIDGN